MYQCKPAGVVGMGMGIDFRGRAVRRPAGMGHPDMRFGQRLMVFETGFQDVNPADRPADVQMLVFIDNGDARGVISPVFEPFKSFDEDWLGNPTTDVRNNTTHIQSLFLTTPGPAPTGLERDRLRSES
jgi:hypothetical protein